MKRKTNQGFTLAETLMVVAIILILVGLITVGLLQYRRSLRQLEYDTIAKEIFFAAQNHLTMADNQGLLGAKTGEDFTGKEYDKEKQIYYFCHTPDSPEGDNVLNLMLPFGSVDETVRAGGSYVIRYQKSTARVLDVFYSDEDDQTGLMRNLGYTFSKDEINTLLGVTDRTGSGTNGATDAAAGSAGRTDNSAARREYGSQKRVIGWYGGDDLNLAKIVKLEAPVIQIINAERLKVVFTNPNYYDGLDPDSYKKDVKIQLIITEKGKKDVRKVIELDHTLASGEEILDDITTPGKHFAELFADFTPGADIEIKAVAYSNAMLANIAESATLTTNSLFASVETDAQGKATANIANIRHLENLDKTVSSFNESNAEKAAKQINDLDWEDFKSKIKGSSTDTVKVYYKGDSAAAGSTTFCPVNPSYTLDYDGQKHSISKVEINDSGSAGLFGTLKLQSSVENLELIDFSVSGATAGALAGTAIGNIKLENVIAHNSRLDDGTKAITATNGSAGGLVGGMSTGSVEACAAAVYVRGNVAGGLIGGASGVTVKDSFSGGHTYLGKYDDSSAQVHGTDNVSGTTAGGLIGSMNGGSVDNCYSTCSAKCPDSTGVNNGAAGGLIGNASGGASVRSSYATGLVTCIEYKGSTDTNNPERNRGRTLIGSGSATTDGNRYLGSVNVGLYVNENDDSDNVAGDANAVSFSSSTAAYTSFFTEPTPADPYDRPGLAKSYEGKYPYVRWLNGSVSDSYYVGAFHYGDWPMETLFTNSK